MTEQKSAAMNAWLKYLPSDAVAAVGALTGNTHSLNKLERDAFLAGFRAGVDAYNQEQALQELADLGQGIEE